MRAPARSPAALALLAWVMLAAAGAAAGRQDAPPAADAIDRPVSAIRIEGLRHKSEQLVRNQIRTAVGGAYDPEAVRTDVHRIYDLGSFSEVTAELEHQPDGTVAVVYRVIEAPIIAEVQVVGNKVVSDQDLLAAAGIARGTARDDFQIETAKRAMEAMYRERGHYLAEVTVDESELESSGILFFRIVEGPRVRVQAIEFEGNGHFGPDELQAIPETRLFGHGLLPRPRVASILGRPADPDGHQVPAALLSPGLLEPYRRSRLPQHSQEDMP
jgi:outer membrane protein insertion porin family